MGSENRYDEEKVIITHEAQTRVRANFVTSYLKSPHAFHTSSAFDFKIFMWEWEEKRSGV